MKAVELQRVVVGVDFARQSGYAAEWIARHVADAGELILVHCLEIPQPPRFLRGAMPDPAQVEATLRSGAEARLAELRHTLGHPNCRGVIRVGKPSEQICQMADETAADLVVAGEHGARRGIWSLMGSTAEKLLACPRPVLLARGLPEGPPRRILAAVEEDSAAPRVLAWGKTLAAKFGAELTAIHVVSDSLYWCTERMYGANEGRKMEETLHQQAGNWLRQQLDAAGIGAEEAAIRIVTGQPDYAIPVAAESLEADLILIGRRSAAGLASAVIGSASRSVIQYATCSVLVLERVQS